jgi:prepilin signal peptidase PulO-like enzyme (type II secretory pathway)
MHLLTQTHAYQIFIAHNFVFSYFLIHSACSINSFIKQQFVYANHGILLNIFYHFITQYLQFCYTLFIILLHMIYHLSVCWKHQHQRQQHQAMSRIGCLSHACQRLQPHQLHSIVQHLAGTVEHKQAGLEKNNNNNKFKLFFPFENKIKIQTRKKEKRSHFNTYQLKFSTCNSFLCKWCKIFILLSYRFTWYQWRHFAGNAFFVRDFFFNPFTLNTFLTKQLAVSLYVIL